MTEAADRLARAHASGEPVEPVRELLTDVDQAYAVQRELARRWTGEGARRTGRKIGLTSPSVQRQLGVDTPDFGALFAGMAVPEGAEIPVGAVLQPRVEAEIALVLDADLTQERHTITELIGACGYALPAIEIVGSRIRDWDISLLDTVADNASAGRYVLGGTPVPLPAAGDLRLAGMVLERRGEPVSTGAGAACLGHPLRAALWLADTLARYGEPLRAGDTILTGALGPVVAAEPGDVFEARIEGLGGVRAAFAKETV
ncbi:2-keto-4-pentenoate hydratase [Sciscionella marina]|uniref:2-keto-4-pentenoate hydratase n=1 Tax=Sciscionella marina TaxID=508770 RepID=UPI0003816925|nr:fumarylacetoacetate hydrolase family protein [Sciscionella marina]